MLIDYKNVNIYQDEKLILKDVNLQVNEGDFIYLIGKVGSERAHCSRHCTANSMLILTTVRHPWSLATTSPL